ncbi:MAG: hypothetical protein Q9218_006009 [Villophora microphyllina]
MDALAADPGLGSLARLPPEIRSIVWENLLYFGPSKRRSWWLLRCLASSCYRAIIRWIWGSGVERADRSVLRTSRKLYNEVSSEIHRAGTDRRLLFGIPGARTRERWTGDQRSSGYVWVNQIPWYRMEEVAIAIHGPNRSIDTSEWKREWDDALDLWQYTVENMTKALDARQKKKPEEEPVKIDFRMDIFPGTSNEDWGRAWPPVLRKFLMAFPGSDHIRSVLIRLPRKLEQKEHKDEFFPGAKDPLRYFGLDGSTLGDVFGEEVTISIEFNLDLTVTAAHTTK